MPQSILYVNPATGNNNSTGGPTAPLKTITRALQIAKGGTIQLASGTYNAASGEVFPLIVPAGVMVLGNEPSKGKGIAIAGSGEYISPTFGSQNITLWLDNNTQLRGVTVTNPQAKGTGVWIESTSPLLANNTLTNCGREGVFVTGTAKPLILDNVFLQNAASNISFLRNAKGEVRRNICRDSLYGMAMGDRAAPLIADNKVFANRTGIALSRDVRPVLRQNLIEKNTQAGLIISDSAQPELGSSQDPAGNILRDNGDVDLQNTSSFKLVSAGNQLSPTRVQGQVEFVTAQFPSRPLGPNQFSDVAGHWAEGFIQALVNRGLISGFPDGSFKPNASMTRAEYAALISKTFDLPRKRVGAGTFADVAGNFWGAAAIREAAEMGFISGFPDGTFRPQQNLTRVQAIASVVSGLGLTGGNINGLSVYRDRAQIPSYATNAVATATQKNLIVNYPQVQVLEPLRDITRGEVASLIYQALVAIGQATAIASPYIISADFSTPSFADIQGHWAEAFIRGLVNQDLISGFANGTFKPDDLLNRAQYAALIVKAFNPTAKRPATQFTDISADFWAATAIQQAYCGGFFSGFPDQTFRPQQNVLKLQLIVSLVNGLGFPAGDQQVLRQYKDREQIPAYSQPAVATATQRGMVVNYPQVEQLTPNREATRAEAAAMVYQALVTIGRLPAIISPNIVSRLSR